MEYPINNDTTHVLYHGNCFDGFCSAWIAKTAGVDPANIIACSYGASPPELPEDARVLLVDFSYPREEVLELKEKVSSLILLDHHKSAAESLVDLPFAYFDLEESGASLAWRFFSEDKQIPKLVEYVRDHDLWRYELPQSTLIRAYIRSFAMEYDLWDELAKDLELHFQVAVQQGAAIQRAAEVVISTTCEQATIGKIGGYEVPVVNATTHFSEIATRLLKLHPESPFAAYYFDRADGIRQWGLRSRSEFDVSKVAQRYGGGGHAQAAGFVTKAPRATGFFDHLEE